MYKFINYIPLSHQKLENVRICMKANILPFLGSSTSHSCVCQYDSYPGMRFAPSDSTFLQIRQLPGFCSPLPIFSNTAKYDCKIWFHTHVLILDPFLLCPSILKIWKFQISGTYANTRIQARLLDSSNIDGESIILCIFL